MEAGIQSLSRSPEPVRTGKVIAVLTVKPAGANPASLGSMTYKDTSRVNDPVTPLLKVVASTV